MTRPPRPSERHENLGLFNMSRWTQAPHDTDTYEFNVAIYLGAHQLVRTKQIEQADRIAAMDDEVRVAFTGRVWDNLEHQAKHLLGDSLKKAVGFAYHQDDLPYPTNPSPGHPLLTAGQDLEWDAYNEEQFRRALEEIEDAR